MSDDSRYAPIRLKEDQKRVLVRICCAGLLLHSFLRAQPWPKYNGWPKKSFSGMRMPRTSSRVLTAEPTRWRENLMIKEKCQVSTQSDCDRSSTASKACTGFYTSLLTKWNERVRKLDFKFHRPYRGWLRCLIKDGHSPVAFLLPLLLLIFVVFGPVPNLASWECWLLFVGSLTGLAIRFVMSKRLRSVPLVAYQVAWIIFVGLIVYLLGGEARASGTLYRHTLVPAIALLIPGLALAKRRSRKLANDLECNCKGHFAKQRDRVSPSHAATDPDLSCFEILRSLVEVLLRRPLATLAGPAVVVVLLPDSRSAFWCFVGSLAIALVIGSFASVHRSMDAMWDVFRRFVAVGGQGVLTFLILVLAVARILRR